jgi:hypothetical protein
MARPFAACGPKNDPLSAAIRVGTLLCFNELVGLVGVQRLANQIQLIATPVQVARPDQRHARDRRQHRRDWP